jgi:predicted extracellular nuclease
VKTSSVLAQAQQFRQADGSSEALFATAPVLLQARLNSRNGDAMDLTILSATLLPTEGIDEDAPGTRGWHTQGAYLQAKRQAQALWLANWLQARQLANPTEKLVVLGAFHAHAFDDGHADLLGLIAGPSTGSARVHDASGPPTHRAYTNLIESVPAAERYTDIAQGNAEATDHILVNRALLDSAYRLRLDFARLNADFGLDNYDDFHVPMRTSAHDPMVLTLEKR